MDGEPPAPEGARHHPIGMTRRSAGVVLVPRRTVGFGAAVLDAPDDVPGAELAEPQGAAFAVAQLR
jgi:hypothetical protein